MFPKTKTDPYGRDKAIMHWASGHGSSPFWYIFFILFSELNLWSRYCSQHRMPDETSKLLPVTYLESGSVGIRTNFQLSPKWINFCLSPKSVPILWHQKQAGREAVAHPGSTLWNALTAFQRLGCLWRKEEREGLLFTEFSLTLRIDGGIWKGCGQETPITGPLLWPEAP